MRLLACFLRDQSGATSVGYGLVAVAISLAIATVLHGIGDKLKDTLIAPRVEAQ